MLSAISCGHVSSLRGEFSANLVESDRKQSIDLVELFPGFAGGNVTPEFFKACPHVFHGSHRLALPLNALPTGLFREL